MCLRKREEGTSNFMGVVGIVGFAWEFSLSSFPFPSSLVCPLGKYKY
jgi:hypothetical protein